MKVKVSCFLMLQNYVNSKQIKGYALLLRLGNIWKYFTIINMKKIELKEIAKKFSAGFNPVDTATF